MKAVLTTKQYSTLRSMYMDGVGHLKIRAKLQKWGVKVGPFDVQRYFDLAPVLARKVRHLAFKTEEVIRDAKRAIRVWERQVSRSLPSSRRS